MNRFFHRSIASIAVHGGVGADSGGVVATDAAPPDQKNGMTTLGWVVAAAFLGLFGYAIYANQKNMMSLDPKDRAKVMSDQIKWGAAEGMTQAVFDRN